MTLSEHTISALGAIITGDGGMTPYRSGPELVRFFNQFGRTDEYGGGFPSRWYYADERIRELNVDGRGSDVVVAALDRRLFFEGKHDPAHFHVYYAEYRARVDIRICEIIDGKLPRKQTKLVLAWAELHQDDLMADWQLVMNGEEPFKIQPLQ